jgi:hypothetical protein
MGAMFVSCNYSSFVIFHFSFVIAGQGLEYQAWLGFRFAQNPTEVGTLNACHQWQMKNHKWKMDSDSR